MGLVNWKESFVLRRCSGLQVFPVKGFLEARTEMAAAAAAAAAGPTPAKEVVEKKAELMKEVFSISPSFHTCIGVSFTSFLLMLVYPNSAGESRNNMQLGFGSGLRRYGHTRWRSQS